MRRARLETQISQTTWGRSVGFYGRAEVEGLGDNMREFSLLR